MTRDELLARLTSLVESMREAQQNGDIEDAHWNADQCLLDAVEMLADFCGLGEQGKTLLDTYAEVPKWYA